MAGARFDWDPRKDQKNREKHGVSFAEAQLAFGARCEAYRELFGWTWMLRC